MARQLPPILFLAALLAGGACGDSRAAAGRPDDAQGRPAPVTRSLQQQATEGVTGTIKQLHGLIAGIADRPTAQAARNGLQQSMTGLRSSMQRLAELRQLLAKLPTRVDQESRRLIDETRQRLDELGIDPRTDRALGPALTRLRDRLDQLLRDSRR